MKLKYLTRLCCVTLLTLSTSACIIHIGGQSDDDNYDGNVSHVMGDIDIASDRQMQDISTVNGDINLDNNVSAEQIDTVNGDITLGKQVSALSVASVNGDISANAGLTVQENISTVNGDINLAKDSQVNGNISTVNGDIHLQNVNVHGELETKNGDISLLKGTVVTGDIIYRAKEQKRWSNNDLPVLTIDSDSTVSGKIILQRKVILEIDDPALLAKVERNYVSEK